MKKYLFVILLFFALPSMGGTKKDVQQLTTEQQQQFSYYWYAARQAIDQERYPDAYVLLQFCDALKPNDGQTQFYLGLMYWILARPDDALKAWEASYKIEPKNTALLDRLLELYMRHEDWKKALEIQDAIDAINGYDVYSAITRFRIYSKQYDSKRAIKEIDRYLEIDPTNLRFLLFRLELMEQSKAKKKDLYALYERILAIDPYNLMVLNNYAWSLATNGGDLNKAEKMSAITIREQPDNPTFLDTYGWIMHLKGEDQLALFYLRKAQWNDGTESTKAEIEKHIKSITK